VAVIDITRVRRSSWVAMGLGQEVWEKWVRKELIFPSVPQGDVSADALLELGTVAQVHSTLASSCPDQQSGADSAS
jgi:hypothetical protein